jgi:hypothetical protein
VYDKDGNHIPVLSKLMETYNNRKHRMTGFSPNEADKDDESTHLAIRLRQSKEQEKIKPRPIKFKVGDKVRISTRTAWAVFKYCGTKTVPLRMKK